MADVTHRYCRRCLEIHTFISGTDGTLRCVVCRTADQPVLDRLRQAGVTDDRR